MRDLKFTVSGQKLKMVGDSSGVIAGTKGYLRCVFDFKDQDWPRCQKIAVFGDDEPVLVAGNACWVPDAVTDGRTIKVQLIGRMGSTSIITNPVYIVQEVTGK